LPRALSSIATWPAGSCSSCRTSITRARAGASKPAKRGTQKGVCGATVLGASS
jgi:hypothetical protein